jgi:hypothetical protein
MNFVKSARYLEDYKIFVEFTSGENGSVDLKDTVFRYEAATEIRDINKFREFYLDDWPTIHTAVYSIEPIALIAGYLPQRQERLAEAWGEIHQQELKDDWNRLLAGHTITPIKPLE